MIIFYDAEIDGGKTSEKAAVTETKPMQQELVGVANLNTVEAITHVSEEIPSKVTSCEDSKHDDATSQDAKKGIKWQKQEAKSFTKYLKMNTHAFIYVYTNMCLRRISLLSETKLSL